MSESVQEEVVAAEDAEQAADDTIQSDQVFSQKDYRPTPYVETRWEVVGERIEERDFVSMTLEVMRDAQATADPMFETFGEGEKVFSDGAIWETPGGKHVTTVEEEEEKEPQIDMKVFEEELAQKFEEGRQAGMEEARQEAEAKIVESYEALGSRMDEVTKGIEMHVQERVQELEKHALRFALEISKKIVETTAQVKPEYILDVIRKGLKNLGAAKPIRVRVSTEDYEFLDVVGLPTDLTPHELGITYVSDESVKSGCIVETDFGEVNLEIDKMWEEVKEKLYPVCK